VCPQRRRPIKAIDAKQVSRANRDSIQRHALFARRNPITFFGNLRGTIEPDSTICDEAVLM
jgi:hypothetical protein